MKVLFIHPNFPGQFRHLANHLASQPGHLVVGMGEGHQLARQRDATRGVGLWGYAMPRPPAPQTHHYLRVIESNVLRGQACLRKCQELRQQGFVPDLICGHAGWGDLLYLREIFPKARVLGYFEYYYRSRGADIGFDPEFPNSLDNLCEVDTKNMTHLLSWESCDQGWSPTAWQRSLFPAHMQQGISVIHEGVDTTHLRPDPAARVQLPDGQMLQAGDEILTPINRNMEPYRGFHVFMRALPDILARRPQARVVIVGNTEDANYGNRPPDGRSWLDVLLAEVGDRIDRQRVHFVGQLGFADYVRVLQVSRAHVYMTYPFILSWSMIEAMACGCLLIASRTPPVSEVIEHGQNGLLFDFFDREALSRTVCEALARPEDYQPLRQAARSTALARYDLQTVCLPQQIELLRTLHEA